MTTEEEPTYYGEVESYFVERRGSPLFITPAEWALVARWEEQGIPLHVVKEGIDRVFERPQAAAKLRKLGYCRQTVEAAFRRFRELRLGGGDGPGKDAQKKNTEDSFDVAAHLSRLASALSGLAPDLVTRVEALGESGRSLSAIEDALSALDEELIDRAEERMSDTERDSLRAEASRSLVSYRGRMPEKVYQSALKSAYRRRLRERAKLPRLSLYDR